VLPPDPPELAETLRGTMRDGAPRYLHAVRPAGRLFRGRCFDLWTQPLAGGGISFLFQDVSARQERETELARLAAEAEEASRAKSRFFAAVSHELRTPLHAIVGWVALLRTRPFEEEARTRALEIIERNARAEAALIEDLLDVSRITLGQLRLTWRPIELAPILSSVIEAIAPTAETKGVTISTDIALDPDITVRGDAARLRQVFWNLLSNAVKFTPAGGHVDVSAHAAEGHAEIDVTDTGRGISPELLPHMFERFGRADNGTTSADRGLGLGLALARELVELHGGTLTAASAGLNQGATFAVTLPCFTARGHATGRASGRTTAPTALARTRDASTRPL
jgi:signal transduction histidine kinase